jgi:hypothetical protein
MLKSLSGGQELGEFVRTARNTYVNPGSVAQFDFHQSDKTKVSFPLLSFLSSNDLMEPARAWYFMTSVFHHLNLSTNLRVLIELEYLQPIDVRLRDLVAQDMQWVENTHCLHSLQRMKHEFPKKSGGKNEIFPPLFFGNFFILDWFLFFISHGSL